MMQRIINSKNLVAFVLAAATGMTLYFRVPFPEGDTFLLIMALRSPSAFEVVKYSYTLFLFSTPYIGYSVVVSGLYIFALKAKQRIRAGRLPLFPDARARDDLFLVVGEVHNPRKQVPAESPQWLVIPERGLFTGDCHPRRNRVRKNELLHVSVRGADSGLPRGRLRPCLQHRLAIE